jgi:hypothetical protein
VLKRVLIVFFMLCVVRDRAQLLDTLRDFFKHKYSIDARFESRYSFINNELISVHGIRLGVAFQRKLRIGGGISWLKTNVNPYSQKNSISDTIPTFLKFVYLSYYVDFVFYKTKRWQLSVPIQAGTGFSWYQQKTKYALGGHEPKYLLLLYEPGITVQFKIFKWAGLGTDVAYRFAINKKAGQQLNSPTYSFKLLVWFDQLFYEIFPNHEITKKYGPANW